MGREYYKKLYLIAALYDILLGFGFLLFYKIIYKVWGMNLPENPAYLSLCAILIGIYGILLFMIHKNPENNRIAIVYAILIKFAFVVVVLYYWLLVGSGYVDVPFRIIAGIDLVFGFLFLNSLKIAK